MTWNNGPPKTQHLLTPGTGYSLEIAESFQVHDKVGPDFPHFLSDEQTLIYERAWGPDQLLCHQLGGEPIVPLLLIWSVGWVLLGTSIGVMFHYPYNGGSNNANGC